MRHSLLFGLLTLGLCASPTHAQIKLDASGSIGLGGAPSSAAAVRAYATGGHSYGLHVTHTTGFSSYPYAVYASVSGGSVSRGVYAVASNATTANYGGQFSGIGGNQSYGVYAKGTGASTNYAGYFSGNVHVTGTLTTGSDAMLKADIEPLEAQNTVALVMQLRPSRFVYSTDPAYADMNLPEGVQYGLIAQDVETVFPELVREEVHPAPATEEGEPAGEPITYKSVNYQQLIPLLVQVVQEQQAEIEALRAILGGLEIRE